MHMEARAVFHPVTEPDRGMQSGEGGEEPWRVGPCCQHWAASRQRLAAMLRSYSFILPSLHSYETQRAKGAHFTRKEIEPLSNFRRFPSPPGWATFLPSR